MTPASSKPSMTAQPSDVSPRNAPLPAAERIAVLDVLRGFALFGVFMVNLSYSAGPSPVALDSPWAWLEMLSSVLIQGLFETKFVTLFSLLFGMGLVLQMERGRARGADITRTYLRRLGILFAMGLVHGILLFEGDILCFYSLAGALLLACHRWPVRGLVASGMALLVVGIGLSLFWSLSPDESFGELGSDNAKAMLEGPLWYSIRFRAKSFLWLQIIFSMISFNWRVVAMFCFGAALMKSAALAPKHQRLHGRLALIGLGLGLVFETYASYVASRGFSVRLGPGSAMGPLATLAHELGSLILALGLGASVVWSVHRGLCQRLASWLAAVGRTALSNYLLQSLLMNALLMWFGLGLWSHFPRSILMASVCLMFSLQVALSVFWTRRFAYGPAEWVWRLLTYARRPPWRLS